MIKADVLITNKSWQKYIKVPEPYINKKLKKIEKKINIFRKNSCNFTLLLSGDSEIKKLNIKFRKKNKITDILSFPFYERKFLVKLLKKKKSNIYLGDIIINLNKIKNKNESFNLSFDKIWIHGLVHLLGYRHKSNLDFSIMRKLESKLLQSIK
jgi:probable rRNA maturation factor|tara:strand:+ start:2325 stop:2786 length:462 start_codon:yes stop_codon:yes gene_type:complete